MGENQIKDILGQPSHVKDVGDCHPVRIKDYDEFMQHIGIFTVNEKHFNKEALKEILGEDYKQLELLDLILMSADGFGGKETLINNFIQIFQLAFRENVEFVSDKFFQGFIVGKDGVIHRENYNEIRKLILRQNVLFEQKVFEDELVREWAETVLKARSKNSIKVTMEDKINLCHVFIGTPYNEIAELSIYQLEKNFSRIGKLKDYDTSTLFQTVSTEKIDTKHYAEYIEFKSPYDDLFVGKDKLSKLNSALGE